MAFKFNTKPTRHGTFETELDGEKVGFGFRRIGAVDHTTFQLALGPLIERKQEASIAYAKHSTKVEAAIKKVREDQGKPDMKRVEALRLIDPGLFAAPTFAYDTDQVESALRWLVDVTVAVDDIETGGGNALVWSELEDNERYELLDCMSIGQLIDYGERVTGASQLKEEIVKKLVDGGNSTSGTNASADAASASSNPPSTTDDDTTANGEA